MSAVLVGSEHIELVLSEEQELDQNCGQDIGEVQFDEEAEIIVYLRNFWKE